MEPSKKALELVGDARRYAMIRLDGEEPRHVYAFQDKHVAEAIDAHARAAAEAMRERCAKAVADLDLEFCTPYDVRSDACAAIRALPLEEA